MTDDRIAAIMERRLVAKHFAVDCDRTNRGCQVPQTLTILIDDMPLLLTEIDRLTAELLQKTQQLASYQQIKIACNDAGFNDFEALLMGYQQVKSDLADAIESSDISDAANTALEGALAASQRREQAARSKGCEVCNGSLPCDNGCDGFCDTCDVPEVWRTIHKTGQYNYCPMCGRKLKEDKP